MRLIQPILLGAFFLVLVCYLRFMRSQLLDRLAVALLFLAASCAVLVPDLTQRIANAVGVGRGTDLTFYLFCAAFLFFAVLVYSRLTQQNYDLTAMVRQIALMEAEMRTASSQKDSPGTTAG